MALYTIEQIYQEKKYTLIYDPKGEYGGLVKLGFKKAFFTSALLQKLTPREAVKIMQVNPRLLYSGYLLTLEEQQQMVNVFAEAALFLGNTLFVIEEASRILENIYNRDIRYIYMVSSEGRSVGVDSIFVYQQLRLISKTTLSQSNTYYCFNITEPLDRQRAAAVLNTDKESIGLLKPREYFYYSTRTGKLEHLNTHGLKTRTKHTG